MSAEMVLCRVLQTREDYPGIIDEDFGINEEARYLAEGDWFWFTETDARRLIKLGRVEPVTL